MNKVQLWAHLKHYSAASLFRNRTEFAVLDAVRCVLSNGRIAVAQIESDREQAILRIIGFNEFLWRDGVPGGEK